MFPLSTALFPGMALPLRLFEDRYLKMYADIVDADREFGVVFNQLGPLPSPFMPWHEKQISL